MTRTAQVTITGLGAKGDGLADGPEGRLYVPFAVMGDVVDVAVGARKGDGHAARITTIITPSSERIDPVCAHFGQCGGCAVQHVGNDLYSAFKRDLIVDALARRGIEGISVGDPLIVPTGARRRTRLSARRTGKGLVLGYVERSGRRLVDVRTCPVLDPSLTALMAPLSDMLRDRLSAGETAHVMLTATDTGSDMVLVMPHAPDLADREAVAAFAEAHNVARISWQEGNGLDVLPEPIVVRREPMVRFGAFEVLLPPGAFLQAARQAEDVMSQWALEMLDGTTLVADLFAGCGTFSGVLAGQASVTAFEEDAGMVTALNHAARRAQTVKPVTVERRDLFRDPLMPSELNRFDGVVIDPPRAGAVAQSEQLAESDVPVIVAFSCNPSTFARDARILMDGGYRLEQVMPIDQFLWSAHVELAAVFRR